LIIAYFYIYINLYSPHNTVESTDRVTDTITDIDSGVLYNGTL